MNGFGKALFLAAAVCAVAAVAGGCASEVALIRGGTSQSHVLAGKDYDQAFAAVIDTAKETGYHVVRQDKDKGTFYLSRGVGYAESTNLEVRIAKIEGGELRIDLVATSSKGGDAVIGEFLSAYRKRVPTK